MSPKAGTAEIYLGDLFKFAYWGKRTQKSFGLFEVVSCEYLNTCIPCLLASVSI